MQGTALVKAVSAGGVRLAWNTWQDPPPPAPLALVLAMPRPRVLRRLWRQIAELGISRVVLTIAENVPPGYSTSEALRPHVVFREVLQVCALSRYPCTSRSVPNMKIKVICHTLGGLLPALRQPLRTLCPCT
jgi:hypothetical protein